MKTEAERENGSATVVGFVLIFAIVVSLTVLYAAAVVPTEEERAAESSVISAKEDMISFSLLLNELESIPYVPVSYMPVFSGSSAAELTSGGSLFVGDETLSLDKLVYSVAVSEIGLSAGGIYRSDTGGAVWLSHPLISGSGDSITCIVPQYHGSLSRGTSSGGIPLTAEYLGSFVKTIQSDSPVSVVYSGEDAKLWYAAFYELSKKYSQAKSPVLQSGFAEITIVPENTMTITVICPEYQIS
ncbi:MAG TPA: hypothetical protein O0X42_02760 [Methanocorpusculum sp.]|nr:hypothetical protein [Methanocorpusculum sp.]